MSIKSLIAYINLMILTIVGIFLFMNIFEYIHLEDSESMFLLYFIGFPAAYIYHKYKPMEFKELLKKIKQKFQS